MEHQTIFSIVKIFTYSIYINEHSKKSNFLGVKMGKKSFGFFTAIISFIFCLVAGIWILTETGFDHGNDATSTAIGLYFIGKAFFVGPMLYIASQKKNDKGK